LYDIDSIIDLAKTFLDGIKNWPRLHMLILVLLNILSSIIELRGLNLINANLCLVDFSKIAIALPFDGLINYVI
jgi:hypothetical protein